MIFGEVFLVPAQDFAPRERSGEQGTYEYRAVVHALVPPLAVVLRSPQRTSRELLLAPDARPSAVRLPHGHDSIGRFPRDWTRGAGTKVSQSGNKRPARGRPARPPPSPAAWSCTCDRRAELLLSAGRTDGGPDLHRRQFTSGQVISRPITSGPAPPSGRHRGDAGLATRGRTRIGRATGAAAPGMGLGSGGKPVVLGTTAKKTFTVAFTATDSSGISPWRRS